MNIPCSVTRAEQDELLRLARGRRVVEAGSLLGATTIKLAAVAPHVVSIDKHEGYGPSTWRPFRSHLERFTRGNVTPLRADVLSVLPMLEGDLVFLDLTGEFTLTRAAIHAAPQNAVLCVHDLLRQNCAGVEDAIYAAGRRIAYAVGTLAVLA